MASFSQEQLQSDIADLKPGRTKDAFHLESRRYLTSLHMFTLTRQYLIGRPPTIIPLTGARPEFSATLLKNLEKVFEVFGNVAGTSENFRNVMRSLKGADMDTEQNALMKMPTARDAITEGYKTAYKHHSAAQYMSRLASLADELRLLIVSISPN